MTGSYGSLCRNKEKKHIKLRPKEHISKNNQGKIKGHTTQVLDDDVTEVGHVKFVSLLIAV